MQQVILKEPQKRKKKLGNNFILLTGEDGSAMEFNARGGMGCISVSANVAPKLCSEFQAASQALNDNSLITKAKEINELLQPLHNSLFIESNPSPVKYAASLLGLCSEDVRLPLVKTTNPTKEIVKAAMKNADLI